MSNNLFKPSKEESKDDYKKREKVVLLLTDWDANVWVNPELAAKMLKDNNIKIYSIWIWSKVWWEISVDTWFWFIQNIKIPPLNLQNEFADIVKQIDKQKFQDAEMLEKAGEIALHIEN